MTFKKLILPGLLALGAPGRAWVAGEPMSALPAKVYAAAGAAAALVSAPSGDRLAAARWLLAP